MISSNGRLEDVSLDVQIARRILYQFQLCKFARSCNSDGLRIWASDISARPLIVALPLVSFDIFSLTVIEVFYG